MNKETEQEQLEGTPCKFCWYAEYDNNTQYGCRFGLIDKYRDLGVEIVDAYDDEKEFFLIKNKVCMYYRIADIFKNCTKEEIQKQNQFKFDAFIYIDMKATLQQLTNTLECLAKQTIPPSRVVFILRPKGKLQPSQIRILANQMLTNIPWKLEMVINQDLTPEECVDYFSQSLKKEVSHYCILCAGTVIDTNTFQSFNDAIIERLEVLLTMYVNEREYIVSKHTHRILGGNNKTSLIAKLTSIGDEQKCRKLNCQ